MSCYLLFVNVMLFSICQCHVIFYYMSMSCIFLFVNVMLFFICQYHVIFLFVNVNATVCALQGLLNVLAAPNTTDEGKMFVEGLQVSENQSDNNKTPIENTN